MNQRPYINEKTAQLLEKIEKRCGYASAQAVLEEAVARLWQAKKSEARRELAKTETEYYRQHDNG